MTIIKDLAIRLNRVCGIWFGDFGLATLANYFNRFESDISVRIHFLNMALEIGQRVQVQRIRDRVGDTLAARLGKTGTVKDFKVLDGQNIGALVTFEADNYTTWFFEDELRAA